MVFLIGRLTQYHNQEIINIITCCRVKFHRHCVDAPTYRQFQRTIWLIGITM